MIAVLQSENEAVFSRRAPLPAEDIRPGIPAADWSREELDRRADWEIAKLKRQKNYAPIYWWLGKVLQFVRESLDDGTWTAWRQEHGIDRTKSQRALFFARVFASVDEIANLSVREAQRLAKRKRGLTEPPTDKEQRLARRIRQVVRKTLPDIQNELAEVGQTGRLLALIKEMGERFGQIYSECLNPHSGGREV